MAADVNGLFLFFCFIYLLIIIIIIYLIIIIIYFYYYYFLQAIHSVFQQDLLRLRLETARSYAKAISASMIPITSSDQKESLKITAQVSLFSESRVKIKPSILCY